MTLQQLIQIEDNAKQVWVISPFLHYDVENKDFSELVSVNLDEKTKYRYIVPASELTLKNIEAYKNKYNVSESDIIKNFLLLPESDFAPFILEVAIYDAQADCIACAAPSIDGTNEVIRFKDSTAKEMAQQFKSIWKKYKRENL